MPGRFRAHNRQIEIEPVGPFSWTVAADVVSTFPPIQHHWRGDPDTVRLAFPLDGELTPVAVALRDDGGVLRGEVSGTDELEAVTRQVARIFSLDHDGTAYPEVGERDPLIGRLMAQRPGQRPVCFTSPYETAVWTIISQRISRQQASRIQQHVIAEHGHRIQVAGEEARCFPVPERLLEISSVPGLMAEKMERLRGVAQAALDGLLDAEHLRALGDEAAPQALRQIHGIGPFWSEGIYLRGCGIRDVFPDEPLALSALARLHALGDPPDQTEMSRLIELYRPFRMWVCFLLRLTAPPGSARQR